MQQFSHALSIEDTVEPGIRAESGRIMDFHTHSLQETGFGTIPLFGRGISGGICNMDEIEIGFEKIIEKIESAEKEKETLTEEIRKNEAALLGRMAQSTSAIIEKVGLNILIKGKTDNQGELYDSVFSQKKMIILGKTDPVDFRPDDINKKVDDQFCALSEEGKFYEIMYSSDGFLVDSYQNEITPREALDIYGYDVMFMLYRAMHDYLKGHEELINALRITLNFTYPEQSLEGNLQ
ncbi:MAG TPA: hypothetical protein VMW63_09425 [Methanoregulaceae archaeon]|nr:hypothetical protein [Methanoregulaceae archaeon]